MKFCHIPIAICLKVTERNLSCCLFLSLLSTATRTCSFYSTNNPNKFGAFCHCRDRETKMSSKPITTNVKPQMLINSTLYKTKKFFNKSVTNLKSFIPSSYEKPRETPIFSSSNMISSKMQELDDFYTSFSEKGGANPVEVVKKKDGSIVNDVEQKRDEQQCSKSSITNSDCSGLEELKEVRKPRKCSGRKQKESSFVAAEVLAQKMQDLEMMDLNDMDHALDVEEVLHYYSRLTCPVYVEIVDKFFMDMYSQFHVSQPSGSLNNSMRKAGLGSVHSSMRSLGPLNL